jgi:hypothetical protein
MLHNHVVETERQFVEKKDRWFISPHQGHFQTLPHLESWKYRVKVDIV